jgi:hypothetical protein
VCGASEIIESCPAKGKARIIFHFLFAICHFSFICHCRLSLVIRRVTIWRHVTIWHLPVVIGHWHLSVGPGTELVFNDK